MEFDGVVKCGTGSLIGKKLVITAASNVFDRENQKLASSVKFVLNVQKKYGEVFEVKTSNIHFN